MRSIVDKLESNRVLTKEEFINLIENRNKGISCYPVKW